MTTPAEFIGESLCAYVENKLGLHISHAAARLLPALVDTVLAEKLEVSAGTLLIKLDQVHYLQDNTPIWYLPFNIVTVSLDGISSVRPDPDDILP